ncbi:MAG TPA: hypothetical protein VHR16_09675 [Candidatus Limnocylindrales bacterium]|nr:hypothetical protein [Candidatus Limnocylindrales bacterium]
MRSIDPPRRHERTRSGSRARAFAALALTTTMAIAGCGTLTPTSSATAPATPPPTAAPPTAPAPSASFRAAAEVYAEIRTEVEAIRGLQPTKAVEPVSLDESQLKTNLAADFDKENTAAELKLAQDELITLGLLPVGSDLRKIQLDFQAGQVAGYYSPEKDQLYVVSRSGGLGGAEMSTYAHEFTHQLDDQVLGLDKLGLDVPDQSDRQLARLALVEGDATSVQSTYMTTELTPQQLGEVLAAASDPGALAALQNAPPYVRETALFPYQTGLAFVSALLAQGGYTAVDAAFKDPPNSTEQVLHPEKYAAREAPSTVEIPAGVATKLGTGWTTAGYDTLGELLLGIWLKQGGVTPVVAATAAAGWGGDRLLVVRGPAGAVGVGLITTWDTAADATEFAAAATTAVSAFDAGGKVAADGARTVVVAMGARAADMLAALAH